MVTKQSKAAAAVDTEPTAAQIEDVTAPEQSVADPTAWVPLDLTAEERSAAIRKSYGSATARLRDAYKDEFEQLQVEEARKLGVLYVPRPSPEAKAEAELKALLESNPTLRQKFGITGA